MVAFYHVDLFAAYSEAKGHYLSILSHELVRRHYLYFAPLTSFQQALEIVNYDLNAAVWAFHRKERVVA